jgi:hypothetical protein
MPSPDRFQCQPGAAQIVEVFTSQTEIKQDSTLMRALLARADAHRRRVGELARFIPHFA